MNIRKFREQINMSQSDLAKLIDVSTNTISKYETNKIYPTIPNLIKLSKIFNVSVDTLIGNDSEIIDVNALTNEQREFVKRVISMEDIDIARVNAYIDAFKHKIN